MTVARSALAAALIAASAAAHAQQPSDASDVAAPLRPAIVAYRQGDTATAERALRSLGSPSADADAWLGAVLLERGAKAEGLKLIQRAADAGSAEGQHRLALVFINGDAGIPPNPTRAVELFEKAAAQGHRRAQLNLGTLYWSPQSPEVGRYFQVLQETAREAGLEDVSSAMAATSRHQRAEQEGLVSRRTPAVPRTPHTPTSRAGPPAM